MSYEIRTLHVDARRLAVVHGRANLQNLSRTISSLGGPIWAMIKSRKIATGGHNVVVYHYVPERNLLQTEEGMPIEIGADVLETFEPDGQVVPSATPGGLVATTTHVGPYHLLGRAHDAVQAWSKAHGHAAIPPCWEVYSHWNDDASKLTTDVFYLLTE